MLTIRPYHPADAAALRQLAVIIQDHGRTIDPRLRSGEQIADEFCDFMRARCREFSGRIFVAAEKEEEEREGPVVGFVSVLARKPFADLDEPPGNYALVTDLAVLEHCRGRGIGRELLDRAEAFAWEAGAVELRIGALTGNRSARRLYRDAGFTPHVEILIKRR